MTSKCRQFLTDIFTYGFQKYKFFNKETSCGTCDCIFGMQFRIDQETIYHKVANNVHSTARHPVSPVLLRLNYDNEMSMVIKHS